MTIQGTLPINRFDRPSDQSLQLNVNQRVTAEVLEVSGDQVTLVIQGIRVVGKLTTSDQAALLVDRQTAQFIIRGMKDGVLQLQLLQQPSILTETGFSLATPFLQLAQNLLVLNDIEVNEQNLLLGKSLLSRGLPVTTDLMNELKQALNSIPGWGQMEADLAASLKAAGMPLSSGTLALAMEHGPTLTEGSVQLQNMLLKLVETSKSPDIVRLAKQALEVLQNGTVDWDQPLPALMKDLPAAVNLWGKSLEAEMAAQLQSKGTITNGKDAATGWTALTLLRSALDQHGSGTQVQEIDRFMNAVRQMHFLNTARSSDPGNPPWLTINLPLSSTMIQQNREMADQRQFFPANLRVAYRSNGKGQAIDPENTRLILSIDLEKGEFLQADLSIIGKRLGAWMTVSSEDLRIRAESEIPSLQSGLEQIGIQLQFAHCDVVQNGPQVAEVKTTSETRKIDIEV
ncbi:MAG: hypothetical protein AB9891_08800 [Anaerolineaceae bacterium]